MNSRVFQSFTLWTELLWLVDKGGKTRLKSEHFIKINSFDWTGLENELTADMIIINSRLSSSKYNQSIRTVFQGNLLYCFMVNFEQKFIFYILAMFQKIYLLQIKGQHIFFLLAYFSMLCAKKYHFVVVL